jgi:hypothetical protein
MKGEEEVRIRISSGVKTTPAILPAQPKLMLSCDPQTRKCKTWGNLHNFLRKTEACARIYAARACRVHFVREALHSTSTKKHSAGSAGGKVFRLVACSKYPG